MTLPNLGSPSLAPFVDIARGKQTIKERRILLRTVIAACSKPVTDHSDEKTALFYGNQPAWFALTARISDCIKP